MDILKAVLVITPNKKTFFLAETVCFWLGGRLLEGTAEQLYNSLDKVKALPPQTKVYFGHNYNLNNLKFALSVEPKNQKLVARYDAESEKQKKFLLVAKPQFKKS